MVLDLSFGRGLYDWFGAHERLYGMVRWISCVGREKHLRRLAIDALAARPGNTILDLASGAGFNLPYIRECVGPTGKILALDYSQGMLATARKKAEKFGWANIEFLQADATQINLEPESLDGAICTFGLSAMPGELAALQRVARALKHGANFVAFDAKPFTGCGRIINPISQPLFKYTTNWNYSKDTIASLRSVFHLVEVEEFNSGCNYLAVGSKL
jgi:ubiquinone/menaquinone biosynthesis C-methylase UbiE